MGAVVRDYESLALVLHQAMRREFDARDWNCARFAHACAEAVTGRKFPFARRGSLERSVDALLPRVPPPFAQRGDVVLADLPQPTLGVCVGKQIAFLGPRGLIHLPRAVARIAWSVA